jgi:hypothetical protein
MHILGHTRICPVRCFIVTLSSTSDESSGWLPPLDSNQHARATCNIVIIIAPRRDYTSFHTRECQECQVEVIVSGSGGGAAGGLREASTHPFFKGAEGKGRGGGGTYVDRLC